MDRIHQSYSKCYHARKLRCYKRPKRGSTTLSETRAVKYALGDFAYSIPIFSTKSMSGHMMGATGAVETIFCVMAIKEGLLPPTINYVTPDLECDLDYVPNIARKKNIRVAMNNPFGFGGHNSVLVIKEFVEF